MPKLVALYIRQIAIGFALSALFVGLLLWLNVANLAHLVFASDIGWLAVVMLFAFNGIVFAGVQFAVVIMGMQAKDDPGSPRRKPKPVLDPQAVTVPATTRR